MKTTSVLAILATALITSATPVPEAQPGGYGPIPTPPTPSTYGGEDPDPKPVKPSGYGGEDNNDPWGPPWVGPSKSHSGMDDWRNRQGGYVPGPVPNTFIPPGGYPGWGPHFPQPGQWPSGSAFNNHPVTSYTEACSSNNKAVSCCGGGSKSSSLGGLIPINNILGGSCTLDLLSPTCSSGNVHCCPTTNTGNSGLTVISFGSLCDLINVG